MRGTNFPGSDRRSSGGGGAETSRYALADKVYDLSRAVGMLRTRSIANVEALRAVAQVGLAFFLSVKVTRERTGGEGREGE